MYHFERNIFRIINITLDTALVILSFEATKLIRKVIVSTGILEVFDISPVVAPIEVTIIILLMAVLYPALLYLNRFYPTSRIKKFRDKAMLISICIFELIFITILISFMFHISFNRTLIVLSGPILFLFAIAKEHMISNLAISRQRIGRYKPAMVIGNENTIGLISRKIQDDNLPIAIKKVFYIMQIPYKEGSEIRSRACLNTDTIIDSLNEESVELAIIAGFDGCEDFVREILIVCEEKNIEVWLESPFQISKSSKTSFGHLSDMPMIVFSSMGGYSSQMLTKIFFDYLVAILLLPVLCIAYVVIGIVIKINSPGSIIVKEEVVGLLERPFISYKFRTTSEYVIEKGEPGLFPFGRFMEKYDLDLLPETLNILKGKMSLIGPYPLYREDAALVKGTNKRFFSMKPGIICPSHLAPAVRTPDINQAIEDDIRYVDDWSLFLDMAIILNLILKKGKKA
ncbi:MAG: sugar transferase [Candidatus Omnitrophica bacterium]|nr:sugar transferase [Candidatus Omnitrophota bacterium]